MILILQMKHQEKLVMEMSFYCMTYDEDGKFDYSAGTTWSPGS